MNDDLFAADMRPTVQGKTAYIRYQDIIQKWFICSVHQYDPDNENQYRAQFLIRGRDGWGSFSVNDGYWPTAHEAYSYLLTIADDLQVDADKDAEGAW